MMFQTGLRAGLMSLKRLPAPSDKIITFEVSILQKLQNVIKLLGDKLVAFLTLVTLVPVFLLIALLIKLDDRGPVFFRQARLGKNAEAFKIWKFRTMLVDADQYLDSSGVATQVRVTRVGRVLRQYSLDELPQLINVLVGDMSIVGPRPVLTSHFARYTDAQRGRFAMKPGITGLAQVRGRNSLKWSKRIELDLLYIQDFSIWSDVRIILETAALLLGSKVESLDRNPGDVDDLGPPRTEK